MQKKRPITLIILDGWGYAEPTETNAITQAKTPFFDKLWQDTPHTLLFASGRHVGLPEGQMGNSEVGHLNLGAGRVVYQDMCRITNAIEKGKFFENTAFIDAIDHSAQNDKAIHIFGLLSPGGIHSLDKHIYAIFKMAKNRGAKKIYMHAFLDGRDTPPKSAEKYIQDLEDVLSDLGIGKIASLIGRFYVMDRDQRWDRVERAYNLFTQGEATYHAQTALEGLKLAYAQGETDEFVQPTSIHPENEKSTTIEDGDSIIFMNFRADRTREITRTFIESDFNAFNRKKVVHLETYVTLTQYDKTFTTPIAFPPKQPKNTLAEYISQKNLTQFHIAETEKYAHVTFFFNGGIEPPYTGEDRHLIHSPQVTTYDLQPEMSAKAITEKIIETIQGKKYDIIICNYANPDMVGHTGNIDATIQAIEYLDTCLSQLITAIKAVGGEAIITADHGNAEQMFDPETGQPRTAHTTNKVPFIYVGRPATIAKKDAALCDVAPTMLALLDLPIPEEMTGGNILKFDSELINYI